MGAQPTSNTWWTPSSLPRQSVSVPDYCQHGKVCSISLNALPVIQSSSPGPIHNGKNLLLFSSQSFFLICCYHSYPQSPFCQLKQSQELQQAPGSCFQVPSVCSAAGPQLSAIFVLLVKYNFFPKVLSALHRRPEKVQ